MKTVDAMSVDNHTRLSLTGDLPSLNDWESFVIDHQRDKLYSYGGVRPYDQSNTPTSDFHCLDLQTMEWKNIGVGASTHVLNIVSSFSVALTALSSSRGFFLERSRTLRFKATSPSARTSKCNR